MVMPLRRVAVKSSMSFCLDEQKVITGADQKPATLEKDSDCEDIDDDEDEADVSILTSTASKVALKVRARNPSSLV